MQPKIYFLILAVGLLCHRCSEIPSESLFIELPSDKTGITFKNEVIQSGDNHVLNYGYFFNGGGVAVGDINNDGLVDIYFTANQGSNKLYLNKGNFQFDDITETAKVASKEGWKTGVTMTDVDLDGWVDIYVCRSAMNDSTLRENLLYINNKDLTFTERGAEFGVNDNSYSTHSVFFDYDNDSDLDLFVLNHSVQRYAGFSKLLTSFKKQKGDKFGSKLYNNVGGKFIEVTEKAGMISNVLSFGLGLAVSDLNGDGFIDLYISNDFNEEDYLYMNNGDGTFKNTIKEATDHVSLFSMGSDIADMNNDGYPDIYTLDMLPASNERIKLSSGDDNYDKYQLLMDAGFHQQTMRNMLQLNNGDGTFSEIGQLAGISNTDWSWAALFTDFDGDGWKDLYVSNGYEKDYTNMQFLKYTVDEQLKSRQTGAPIDLGNILSNMPSINEGNFLFMNNRNLTFTNKTVEWGITTKNKSNGAAYADLDNDGDLDLVVNAMNATALIYKNTIADAGKAHFVKVDLLKNNPGSNVVGTKVIAYSKETTQYLEFSVVHGYESSMIGPLTFGLGNATQFDSVKIIWPDQKEIVLKDVKEGEVSPSYNQSKAYPRNGSEPVVPYFKDVTLINWVHTPAAVNDFKRQLLLPRMYSYTGPKMAVGDVNGDKLDDVFICGPKGQSASLFLQNKNGTFKESKTLFGIDKDFQDEFALFFDADGDGDLDLYVVSGGYLFETNDPLLQDRLYRNDGHGNFKRDISSLPHETQAGSVVTSLDIDGDADLDLFVGGRIVPGQYPTSPQSYLLINDGKGTFIDQTKELAPGLSRAGMVCDAHALDLDKDGFMDLLIAGEWMPVQIWMNRNGKLMNETNKWFPFKNNGWWNTLEVNDFDNDGDLDIVAGNAGTNNQFGITENYPAMLVVKDFNDDNQVDPFFCYFINGKSYPYASRDEALGQVSFLKSRFPDYRSYANATLADIFTAQELKDTLVLKANEIRTCYFENKGQRFEKKELPIQSQWSPVYSIVSIDVNRDGLKDLIMGGNESLVRVRLGRNSANRGMVFLNKGNNLFEFLPNNKTGINLPGDVRDIQVMNTSDKTTLWVGAIDRPIQTLVLKKVGL
ncbi:MAG: VCBS repeat-containing protein [Cyclobacteriaceae bacterium]|nr:VCBS repeat-containing protein [Cyclobacteriaceae bacterium]